MTAPGWGKHLKGIDTKSLNSRAALAKLPVLRKADLTALQKQNPRLKAPNPSRFDRPRAGGPPISGRFAPVTGPQENTRCHKMGKLKKPA
jgi:hypothetical protein